MSLTPAPVPVSADAAGDPQPATPGGQILGMLRRNRAATAGAAFLAAMIVVAAFAPVIAPYSIHQQAGPVYGPPSAGHWLGLDDTGIDMLSLLIWSLRISLIIGFAAALVSVLVGGTLGVIAGYFGRHVDLALTVVIDYFIVIPALPLLIVMAAVWGPGLWHMILLLGLLLWTSTARLVRGQVTSEKSRGYVRRAQAIGAGHWQIMVRHILPHVGPLIVANTVLNVAAAIFAETAVAFLGLGDPTQPSLGLLIANAFSRNAITAGAWWAIIPPGVLVTLLVFACVMIGQSVEDALNPRLRAAYLSIRRYTRIPSGGSRDE